MGFDSVVTVVGTRNDDRQHLPLRPRQRRLRSHRRGIQIEHRLQGLRVLALNLEDVENPPRSFTGGVVDYGEVSGCVFLVDRANPGHDGSLPHPQPGSNDRVGGCRSL